MNNHIMFSSSNKKNIYLMIWVLLKYLAKAIKSLSQAKIENSYLSSGKSDKLDKSGMLFPQPCVNINNRFY